ncbi:MAG: thioredoxin family protein [Hyphomicrobiaceae bacterium]|nr:thioredoxin family protein [Hyphomicrobiaceae bacterium]
MAATAPRGALGAAAPAFSLPATDGRILSLADSAGPRGTLVAFICNHCPYVVAVIDRFVRDARDLAPLGIGVVAISANDARAYPEDSFPNMQAFALRHGLPFPYLYDESQTVALAYGAVCTPDFFGFDADLKLAYRGRLDASRKDAAPAGTRRELYEAMRLVATTGAGPAEQHPAVGCSIKWR